MVALASTLDNVYMRNLAALEKISDEGPEI